MSEDLRAPKLRSGIIMALIYLLFAMLGIFWRSLRLYEVFIQDFLAKFGKEVTVDLLLIDSFFVACGFLSLIISYGLIRYTRSTVLVSFVSSLALIVVSFVVLVILIIVTTKGFTFIDEVNTLFLTLLFLPIFLPLALFNAIAFYFILRNLNYIRFVQKE